LHILSIPPLMMASINFYVGAYYLFFFMKRRQVREHLPFALLCLSVGFYDVLCVGLYNSLSVGEGVFWQRLQFDAVIAISVFLVWFTGVYTEQKGNLIIRLFIAWFIIVFLASFFISPEYSLSPANPDIKIIHLKYLPEMVYYECAIGIFYQVETATAIIAYLYLFYLFISYYWKTRKKIIFLILACQIAYFLGVINDSLIAMKFYSFIYLSEYSFFLIIIAMAYILLDKFVRLHTAFEELNVNLEQRVYERTNEILKAQAQVKQLEGIIPICMYCKKIRDDTESWHQLEKYISEHSEAEFSHSICPGCLEKVKLTIPPNPDSNKVMEKANVFS
jgi:hypothetical protein